MSPTRAMLPFLLLFFIFFYDVAAQPPLSQPSLPLPTSPPQTESVNFKPMIALMIVFSVSSLLFVIFFTIYSIDCTSPTSSPRSNLSVPKGLDPKVIGGFPTFVYLEVKEHKIGKGALECAVCLCEFKDMETLRFIQKCDHVFHQECIDEWLSGHVTCPVCRANLTPPSVDSVKGRTDCPGLEEQSHVEIDIDEGTVTTEEVMHGKNEEGGAEQSNWDLGRESHWGKLPCRWGRSHSTGHSLLQPKDDTERFTLRLPDEVRKQIMERPTTLFLRRLDRLDQVDLHQWPCRSRPSSLMIGIAGRINPANQPTERDA